MLCTIFKKKKKKKKKKGNWTASDRGKLLDESELIAIKDDEIQHVQHDRNDRHDRHDGGHADDTDKAKSEIKHEKQRLSRHLESSFNVSETLQFDEQSMFGLRAGLTYHQELVDESTDRKSVFQTFLDSLKTFYKSQGVAKLYRFEAWLDQKLQRTLPEHSAAVPHTPAKDLDEFQQKQEHDEFEQKWKKEFKTIAHLLPSQSMAAKLIYKKKKKKGGGR
ncbi:hypothetical protein RFI_18231, partial [Reticulomyxa filosa]